MSEFARNEVAIILLAAGSSSRMGTSKQLITIDGVTLLEKSIKVALQSGSNRVLVVLGANGIEHRRAIENYPITIVHNPDWAKGMGSSLKAGLIHLTSVWTNLQAVLVMVCDQPLLTSSHLTNLIERYTSTHSPIVASSYSGSMGVPALFGASMLAKLSALDDRQGAKIIIESSKEFVNAVDFPEGSVDLDTPEDVKRFLH